MRSPFLAIILGLAWTPLVALAQVADNVPADLRLTVADLSHDSFASRERATRILWESGNQTLVAEIVKHGASTEARSRAAQVLSSYRWGIVPGISETARAHIERFRNGGLSARRTALSGLMQAGYLRKAAGCLSMVDDPVTRKQLNQHLQELIGKIIPREFAEGHDEEIHVFLTLLASKQPAYQQDLDSLAYHSDDKAVGLLAPAPDDEPLPKWLLSIQTGDTIEAIRQTRSRGRDAAIFDFLMGQQLISDAIASLRAAVKAEAMSSATDVLRNYLKAEIAKVKTQHYSKRALGLPNSAKFQPTGIVLSNGFRHTIRFCNAYGLTDLNQGAGDQVAARLIADSPEALPAFCTWASYYPELRELAVDSARAAHVAGVSAEFAFGPMCSPFSQRGRWFGQLITSRERRDLLANGVQNGGWSKLSDINARLLTPAGRGRLAMAVGDWPSAAKAFIQGVGQASTLAEGAMLAFLASFSFDRSEELDVAMKWRQIAEAIPLGNEEARAALADTMQRFGDGSAARRNRILLIDLHQTNTHATIQLHTLRLAARSLDLTKDGDVARATNLSQRIVRLLTAKVNGGTGRQVHPGEMAQDSALFYHCRMINAFVAKKWNVAAMELRSAHQCAPGSLDIFETVGQRKDTIDASVIRTVGDLLEVTTDLWERASADFPGNLTIARKLARCRVLTARLEDR